MVPPPPPPQTTVVTKTTYTDPQGNKWISPELAEAHGGVAGTETKAYDIPSSNVSAYNTSQGGAVVSSDNIKTAADYNLMQAGKEEYKAIQAAGPGAVVANISGQTYVLPQGTTQADINNLQEQVNRYGAERVQQSMKAVGGSLSESAERIKAEEIRREVYRQTSEQINRDLEASKKRTQEISDAKNNIVRGVTGIKLDKPFMPKPIKKLEVAKVPGRFERIAKEQETSYYRGKGAQYAVLPFVYGAYSGAKGVIKRTVKTLVTKPLPVIAKDVVVGTYNVVSKPREYIESAKEQIRVSGPSFLGKTTGEIGIQAVAFKGLSYGITQTGKVISNARIVEIESIPERQTLKVGEGYEKYLSEVGTAKPIKIRSSLDVFGMKIAPKEYVGFVEEAKIGGNRGIFQGNYELQLVQKGKKVDRTFATYEEVGKTTADRGTSILKGYIKQEGKPLQEAVAVKGYKQEFKANIEDMKDIAPLSYEMNKFLDIKSINSPGKIKSVTGTPKEVLKYYQDLPSKKVIGGYEFGEFIQIESTLSKPKIIEGGNRFVASGETFSGKKIYEYKEVPTQLIEEKIPFVKELTRGGEVASTDIVNQNYKMLRAEIYGQKYAPTRGNILKNKKAAIMMNPEIDFSNYKQIKGKPIAATPGIPEAFKLTVTVIEDQKIGEFKTILPNLADSNLVYQNTGKFSKITSLKPSVIPAPYERFEPTTQPISRPMLVPYISPINKPKTEPYLKPFTQPISRPSTEPITQPLSKPITEPLLKPLTQPIMQPLTEPLIKPAITPNMIMMYPEFISVETPWLPNEGRHIIGKRIRNFKEKKSLGYKPTLYASLGNIKITRPSKKGVKSLQTTGLGIRPVIPALKEKALPKAYSGRPNMSIPKEKAATPYRGFERGLKSMLR
jgi:hypothetical protein